MTLEEILTNLQSGMMTQAEAIYEIQHANAKSSLSRDFELPDGLNELDEFFELYPIAACLLNNSFPIDSAKYTPFSKLSLLRAIKAVAAKIPLRGKAYTEYASKLEAQLAARQNKPVIE